VGGTLVQFFSIFRIEMAGREYRVGCWDCIAWFCAVLPRLVVFFGTYFLVDNFLVFDVANCDFAITSPPRRYDVCNGDLYRGRYHEQGLR
jgi:hypothetical protein